MAAGLAALGVPVEAYFAARACAVRLQEGEVSACRPSLAEAGDGHVLACYVRPVSDVRLSLA